MTDRPTPNPPAWVHTRLSNLEAAVGDLTVRASTEAPSWTMIDAELRNHRDCLDRHARALGRFDRELVSLAEYRERLEDRLAALEAAASPKPESFVERIVRQQCGWRDEQIIAERGQQAAPGRPTPPPPLAKLPTTPPPPAEAAATPVCAPVAAATGPDGAMEPTGLESALSDIADSVAWLRRRAVTYDDVRSIVRGELAAFEARR